MTEKWDHNIHVTHCCVSSCKYMEDDCPVATGKVLPKYKCEDCTCLTMNPGSDKQAEEWWANLHPSQKSGSVSPIQALEPVTIYGSCYKLTMYNLANQGIIALSIE